MTRPNKVNGIHAINIDLMAKHQQRKAEICQRKRRFSDEHAARYVGVESQAFDGVQLYIYQCDICRGWHLTRAERPAFYAVDYYVKGNK